MTTPLTEFDGVGAVDELLRFALMDLAPGTAASITLAPADDPVTVVATDPAARLLDHAQYRLSDGPCLTAIRAATQIEVEDFVVDNRWPAVSNEALALGIRSSLSISLARHGRVIGGLNLYAEHPHTFGPKERQHAERLARHLTSALQHRSQVVQDAALRNEEHQLAAALQRSLLPTLPRLHGVACAARYESAGETVQVGGDWFDAFPLPSGAIAVTLGDVMGHDATAAATMGQLRAMLRSTAYRDESPAVVLDHVNTLVEHFHPAQVASLVYARLVVDGSGALLVFANAGHPPPLVRLPDGSIRVLEGAVSPLVGVPSGHRRPECAVDLPAGALLLFYTDGLVESRHRDFDRGLDALVAALGAQADVTDLDAVCQDLLSTVADREQEDDIALLLLRIDPVVG